MTARDVLLLFFTAFYLASLLLIYDAYYRPVSTRNVGLPAVSEPSWDLLLPYPGASAMTLGIAIAIGLGAVLGALLFDNAATGVVMGIAVGAAYGYFFARNNEFLGKMRTRQRRREHEHQVDASHFTTVLLTSPI